MAAPPPISGTILVADDSAGDRAAARSILEEAGYKVVEAVDGNQALELTNREAPDLVILDVVMPKIGGLEACRILKAQTQGTYLPVLMVSTRSSVAARVEGLRSGADDYLGKPYDPTELAARVDVLLRTRAAFTAQARRNGAPAANERRPAERIAAREAPTSSEIREAMAEELARAGRYNDPLALLRIAASRPLADERLATIVRRGLRRIDLVDVGGGEATLLLPDTHFPGALAVAERIVRGGRKEGVAVNVGVSFFPHRDTTSFPDMVEHAGVALAEARQAGGGTICLYQHQGYLYAPSDQE
ncbi:MAG: response regulator [Myxococcales bacterium]|nr:response regulator [Myxococcales bacterium]